MKNQTAESLPPVEPPRASKAKPKVDANYESLTGFEILARVGELSKLDRAELRRLGYVVGSHFDWFDGGISISWGGRAAPT